MVFEIFKISHFDDEVMEVAAHYFAISPDLYSRFYFDLNIALNKLEENPFAYFNLELKPFRRIVLRSFPFAIIFRVEGNYVYVLVLFPLRDDPSKLFQKLSN